MADYQNCPNCGQPAGPDDRFCSNCGQPLEPAPPPPPPASPVVNPPDTPIPSGEPGLTGRPRYVAWEDRGKLGFFKSLWETWRESVFYPDRFFSRLPFTGGIGGPLLYALIVGWASYAVNRLIQWLFSGMMMGYMSSFFENQEIFEGLGLLGGLSLIHVFLSILFAPIIIVIVLFVESGIYHLLLMIFGWAKRDFEATLRAVAYSSGPFVFMIVPMCGSFLSFIWALVLTIIGIKHMHETTGGKASLVVLLPLILCCCLIAILAMIFGAMIATFIQGIISNGGYYYD